MYYLNFLTWTDWLDWPRKSWSYVLSTNNVWGRWKRSFRGAVATTVWFSSLSWNEPLTCVWSLKERNTYVGFRGTVKVHIFRKGNKDLQTTPDYFKVTNSNNIGWFFFQILRLCQDEICSYQSGAFFITKSWILHQIAFSTRTGLLK